MPHWQDTIRNLKPRDKQKTVIFPNNCVSIGSNCPEWIIKLCFNVEARRGTFWYYPGEANEPRAAVDSAANDTMQETKTKWQLAKWCLWWDSDNINYSQNAESSEKLCVSFHSPTLAQNTSLVLAAVSHY